MSLPVKLVIWIWLVVLLLVAWHLTASPANAHATAAAEGIPPYVYQSGCCGRGDCRQIPVENVTLLSGGYRFTAPQPDWPDQVYVVMEGDKKLRDSSDGKYWACFYMGGKECLETGNNGTQYPPCIRYAPKGKPWQLRCFFRPVNA
jgi:hypothetical protein